MGGVEHVLRSKRDLLSLLELFKLLCGLCPQFRTPISCVLQFLCELGLQSGFGHCADDSVDPLAYEHTGESERQGGRERGGERGKEGEMERGEEREREKEIGV